jgi:Transcription elongation factor Elf1 like
VSGPVTIGCQTTCCVQLIRGIRHCANSGPSTSQLYRQGVGCVLLPHTRTHCMPTERWQSLLCTACRPLTRAVKDVSVCMLAGVFQRYASLQQVCARCRNARQMGKRKSSKPPPKKQKPKLATQFACPFCNTDNSVSCQFDRARDIGTVSCNACQVRHCDPRCTCNSQCMQLS